MLYLTYFILEVVLFDLLYAFCPLHLWQLPVCSLWLWTWFFMLLFCSLAILHRRWHLSFLIWDWTHAPYSGSRGLTTGLPENSQTFSVLMFDFFFNSCFYFLQGFLLSSESSFWIFIVFLILWKFLLLSILFLDAIFH